MAWNYPLTFDSKEPFCACVVSPLSFTQMGFFSSLCPCHDYSPDVLTRDKDWLFTLFTLLLPYRRGNRRLIVNVLTGAHLSLVSGNANSFTYPA